MGLREDIASILNRHSAENGSNTPDGILAEYLLGCLAAWDRATVARDKWYGVNLAPGMYRTPELTATSGRSPDPDCKHCHGYGQAASITQVPPAGPGRPGSITGL